MRNIKLKLAYDGTRYHGWQRQENALGVQQVLEQAIFEITRARATVIGCGRTDAGVHALGYVCSFKTEAGIPIMQIPIALNNILPKDIRVLDAEDAPPDFNAQFDACSKTYRYTILNKSMGDPFICNTTWHYPVKLDVEKMRRAARDFVGCHDFAAFMASGCTVKSTVRTIFTLELFEKNDIIEITVSANGFLYNMVRIITGTLVYVGNGKITAPILSIIQSADRRQAGITAPPQGLSLIEVRYSCF